VITAIVGLLLAAGPFGQEQSQPEPVSLKCERGPVHRVFGGTPWLVYGCDDGASIVIVSGPGSPAAPFYFLMAFKDGAYWITGEGNGNQAATTAAFEELKLLDRSAITALAEEARGASD
jgi:hypothetical protein